MPDFPAEDDPLGFDPHTGQAITRRTIQLAHETAARMSSDFILSIRRLFAEELTLEQLGLLQQLFTDLGRRKNPAVPVSWWEGQLDAIVWARGREAAYADLAPAPIPETLTAPHDEPTAEVESAVVEGTLNRHAYDTGADPFGVPCVFTASVPGIEGLYVCGLDADAPPHRAVTP